MSWCGRSSRRGVLLLRAETEILGVTTLRGTTEDVEGVSWCSRIWVVCVGWGVTMQEVEGGGGGVDTLEFGL